MVDSKRSGPGVTSDTIFGRAAGWCGSRASKADLKRGRNVDFLQSTYISLKRVTRCGSLGTTKSRMFHNGVAQSSTL